ncbi:MAG: AbrB/MazE/SpoVT family DNA-binding domain-containing protein [Acidobacteriota bacterium]|jgi:AbrB family looped-hinge helix DNA binding protein|nr:AbrB/MazE/SpoVT family DNA-binding domain-containing protein [Acidobacteriota bacterium]
MRAYRTTISSKGQVVIPAELREQFGLKKGTAASWSEERGKLVLTPLTEMQLDGLMGFLKPVDGVSLFEASFEERTRERQGEESGKEK